MRQLNESLSCLLPDSPHALIDVRSEFEFEQSAIPGFVSLPLLYQDERRQVGICYKAQGQDAAISLGHQLVDPYRPQRVQAWAEPIKFCHSQTGIIMCWRGGLRSQIATQWIREAGYNAQQLAGGYKRLRQYFLEILNSPPPLIIISGLTGSGKSELLREFPNQALDLEALGNHRGSAFGEQAEPQPRQTRFENAIALSLFKGQMIVEDESRLLGRLSIPDILHKAMQIAPMIYLESPLQERVMRIYEEYVVLPLAKGLPCQDLEQQLLSSLDKVKRRLDKNYPLILEQLKAAFMQEPSWELHRPWIEGLLIRYYDPLYNFATEKNQRKPVLRGDRQTCRAWLQERLVT